MPALAQTQPALRLDDQHPALGADHAPRLSRRTSSTRRGSLPSPLGRARAPGRRARRRRGRAPAPRPSRRPSARRRPRRRPRAPRPRWPRRGDQLAERGRRLRPRAGRRTGTISTPAAHPRARPPSRRRAPARPPSPGRGRARARAPRPARRGRRGCRGRAPASRAARPRPRDPAAPARSRVAGAAARAERRADRVGGREQQRVGAGAVAVGDDRHPAAAHPLRAPRRARPGRAAGSRRAAAPTHSAPSALRPDDPERRRLRVAGSSGSRSTSSGVGDALRVAKRDPLGAPLAGDDDHPLDQLGAAVGREHVGEHRLDERGALRAVEAPRAAAAWRRRSASPG